VRGPHIFKGYYKQPDKTAETIDAQGWLHSGDVGMWTPEGRLVIIDRKKNIFKLAQGEYVAAEKIENVLMQSEMIAQAFVYGDSLKSELVAIVVPDAEAVQDWARQESLPVDNSFAELCRQSLLEVNKECSLFNLSSFWSGKIDDIILIRISFSSLGTI
jgi:long-chain acyl-CoA synthetase